MVTDGKPIAHPVWCDPGFCTAPDEQPTDAAAVPRGASHHSTPVELEKHPFAFVIPHMAQIDPSRDLTDGGQAGVWAWLTQGVMPWKCTTYLQIGLWHPSLEEGAPRPEGLLHLPLELKHRIAPAMYEMSAGERLAHLIEHALSTDLEALHESTRVRSRTEAGQ